MFENALIEKWKQISTPFYFYDVKLLQETLRKAKIASEKYHFVVHFAVKSNFNSKILRIIQQHNFGSDCVSGNEIEKSIKLGFKNDKIVFAGVGKSDNEILSALENEIFCFNVESTQEISVINEIAKSKNCIAPIALRINPDISAHTHVHITTGLEENKFGISRWQLEEVLLSLENLKNVKLIGLHFHIGSQITDLTPFKNLCTRVNEILPFFEKRNIFLPHINVGGGLGIDYHFPEKNSIPDFDSFFAIFHNFLKLKPSQTLHFELGRALVGQCGSLISKVLYVKETKTKKFVILDAGMTELIRPALYQAYHKIENVTSKSSETEKYDVVGPICESSDCFGKEISLPKTLRNDIFAIRSAGAYGEAMSSQYNLRNLPKGYFSDEI